MSSFFDIKNAKIPFGELELGIKEAFGLFVSVNLLINSQEFKRGDYVNDLPITPTCILLERMNPQVFSTLSPEVANYIDEIFLEFFKNFSLIYDFLVYFSNFLETHGVDKNLLFASIQKFSSSLLSEGLNPMGYRNFVLSGGSERQLLTLFSDFAKTNAKEIQWVVFKDD